MLDKKSFFLFSISICLTLLKADVEVLNRTKFIHRGYLMMDSYSFKDGILVYGICNGHREQVNCTIVQTKHPYTNDTYNCNVTLNTKQDDAEIYSRIGLAALGQDKAVIFWHEEGVHTFFNFGTVQLKSCKMTKAKVNDVQTVSFIDLFHSQKIITYKDDSYDVVFQDSNICGEKACKITINGNGKVIKEAKPYITTHGQFMGVVSSVTTGSPANGLIYTIIESGKSILWMITAVGKEKRIAVYEGYPIRSVASNHDMISICSRTNTESYITCTQYDKDGDLKTTTNLTGIEGKTIPLIMYNLPTGGYLVMLVEYEHYEKNNYEGDIRYRIHKIDENGKQSGNLQLKEFESIDGKKEWGYIYETGDDKYCAVLVGNEITTPHGDLHIVSNCFTITDLSM